MKFILLASGKIAENFLNSESFSSLIKSNMIGLVATKEIISLLKEKFDPAMVYKIGGKFETEAQLIKIIEKDRPDYLISIQYPWILSRNIIDSMSGRVLNLHNAKLPDYRGHNTISHEILNQEKIHTTTLHWISEEVDRGRIVKIKEIEIYDNDTAYSLWARSIDSALSLLQQWFLDMKDSLDFPKGTLIPSGGNYYSIELTNYKRIPNLFDMELVDRWGRAFWFPPHEPAFISFMDKKIYLLPEQWNYSLNNIDQNND